VGDEDHRHAPTGGDPGNQRGNGALAAEIEVCEGLVKQEESRLRHQRLGQPQSLLLATGQAPEGPVGVGLGPDRGDGFLDPVVNLTAVPNWQGEAPAMPLQAHRDQVASPHRKIRINASPLG